MENLQHSRKNYWPGKKNIQGTKSLVNSCIWFTSVCIHIMNPNKLPSHYLTFHAVQHILCLCGHQDSSAQDSDCAMGWTTNESGFNSKQRLRLLPSSKHVHLIWNPPSLLSSGYCRLFT
jgi:hypothetical protein